MLQNARSSERKEDAVPAMEAEMSLRAAKGHCRDMSPAACRESNLKAVIDRAWRDVELAPGIEAKADRYTQRSQWPTEVTLNMEGSHPRIKIALVCQHLTVPASDSLVLTTERVLRIEHPCSSNFFV